MPGMRIVIDAEATGLGLNIDPATMINLGNDDEIVVSGLRNGTRSGAPSMVFAFTLPDGRVVLAQTTWRMFAFAFWQFAERFGSEKPDLAGMTVEYDASGAGHRVRLAVQSDDKEQWFVCELCGARKDAPAGEAGALEVAQWVHRHYREKHPDAPAPVTT